LQVTFFAQSALTLPMQKHYHKVPRLYKWTYKGNKPNFVILSIICKLVSQSWAWF